MRSHICVNPYNSFYFFLVVLIQYDFYLVIMMGSFLSDFFIYCVYCMNNL